MVLKNLVRYIINKYLKDYIEQLDDDKLKLDLTNGNLDCMRLKDFFSKYRLHRSCLSGKITFKTRISSKRID